MPYVFRPSVVHAAGGGILRLSSCLLGLCFLCSSGTLGSLLYHGKLLGNTSGTICLFYGMHNLVQRKRLARAIPLYDGYRIYFHTIIF